MADAKCIDASYNIFYCIRVRGFRANEIEEIWQLRNTFMHHMTYSIVYV